MKKLLLLSAFFIFACSSDDSSNTNDTSNQTFLERFDGVVWQNDLFDPSDPENPQADPVYLVYNNSEYFFNAGWFDPELECASFKEGYNDDGLGCVGFITIDTNLSDNFKFINTDCEGDSGSVEAITFNNGNALRLIFSDGMQEQIFSRTNINNPCN